MASLRQVTPGTMSVTNAPSPNKAFKPTWWCQSTVHPNAAGFQSANAASDLAAGLAQLGVTKYVVLVSHSLEGETATYFVNEHSQRTTGAVLVDASLPEFYKPRETTRIVAANQQQIAALKAQPQTRTTPTPDDGSGPVEPCADPGTATA